MEKNKSWFLHVDLDAFFASVEQLDHPEYRGKPLIVGGKPEDKRSVVSTASYEARKYGVHSAMPTSKAYQLCPQGIFVYGRMERYSEISYEVMSIFREFSPDVDQMSIDEAFIDLTGTEALFGPPEETAKKIKQRVKEKTGLTVSVGLAPTKYIAKIASDLQKPDGFVKVDQGHEQEFMLSLPLKKLWGCGTKTQELFKTKGIKSTKDIYDLPVETLQFFFGNSLGNFLYNVVRGNDLNTFNRITKSHSISSETTFVEDISDPYTIETKILELCHGIIFRILKEKLYSRTVKIKIRYGNFTTVSIQKTVDYNILTLDSFFNIAKELFNEKYDRNFGVRLIGVGLENLEKKPFAEQLSLFDDDKEKKQSVEKAILNLEQKHPEIKLHKARLLNTLNNTAKVLLLSFALLFAVENTANSQNTKTSQGASALLTDEFTSSEDDSPDEGLETPEDEVVEITADQIKTEETKEVKKTSLFDWEIPETNLNYDLSGHWTAEVTQNFNASFGKYNGISTSLTSPIFKQEIDLSLLINITKNFYFDFDFADNFSKNTYTFGYKGDGYLEKFIFSNRNILFPDYSSKYTGYALSGGQNQAPGLSFHFKDIDSNKWTGDVMLRYDMTSFRDATFYGKNSVTDINLELSSFIYGKMFVFPDKESLLNLKDIYVENSKGNYLDKNGRKYKKLSEAEYKIISSENLLILSISAESSKKNNRIPAVTVTFKDDSTYSNFILSSGNYGDSSSFLGHIQEYFNSNNNQKINLEKYASPIENFIENTKAISIQSPEGFSPYLICNFYDCGIISQAEASIISPYSENISQDYFAIAQNEPFSFTQEDFFYENHLYAETGKNSEKNSSYLNPAQRYPFADKNPLLYLNETQTSDLTLRLRTYSQISNYDIGKKAAGGTVKVYVNGILDNGAKYSSTSGFVTLSTSVSEIDKIYISWQEESDDIDSGALALAAGYKYNFNENLKTDISISSLWPVNLYSKYSTKENLKTGFLGITGGINYKYLDFTILDALTVSLNNENLTGVYLASKDTGITDQTYYLSSSSGYQTKALPSLNYKDAPVLEEDNNGTVLTFTGKGDGKITGYKIPLSWDFSSLDKTDKNWASVDIKLTAGSQLCNSSELELALKADTAFENVDIYLQLGVKAEKDFSGETSSFIPTWKLTDGEDLKTLSGFDTSDTSWQIIKIQLDENDRARLVSSKDLRLIVVSKDETSTTKGTIWTGPYEPVTNGIYVLHNDSILVNSSGVLINESSAAKKYFKTDLAGNQIVWNNIDSSLSQEDLLLTTATYFDYCNFASYEEINFDFGISATTTPSAFTPETGLSIILDSGAESLDENGQIALELNVSSKVISNLILQEKLWHNLKIELKTKKVYLDDKLLPASDYELKINTKTQPSRQKIVLNTASDSSLMESGKFIIGSLYFTGSELSANAKNYFAGNYSKDQLWIIKNLRVDFDSSQAAASSITDPLGVYSLDANLKSNATIWNFDIAASISTGANSLSPQDNFYKVGSHSIKTNKNIFDAISFSESYLHNPQDKEIEKSNSLNINLSRFKIPFAFSSTASSSNSNNYMRQNLKAGINSSFPIGTTKFSFDSSFALSQKLNNSDGSLDVKNNYFIDYGKALLTEFSIGEENASTRNENLNAQLKLTIPYGNLNPVFKFTMNGTFQNSSKESFSDNTSMNLNIPFGIGKNTFSIILSKTAGGKKENPQVSNYGQDIELFAKTQKDRSWYYTTLPFLDLFSPNLSSKLQENIHQEAFYNSRYEINWKRTLSNNISDLYIPVSASLSFARDISTSDTVSDLYQIKLTAGNAFVNLLGAKGKLKLIKEFNQDEYTSFFTGIIKIPNKEIEKTTCAVSWYGSLLLYKNNKDTLKTGMDFTLSSNLDWKFRATAIWSYEGENTILLKIPEFIFKNTDFSDKEIIRKETLNITLSDENNINSQLFQLNHSCEMKLLKNYTITAGAGMNLKFTESSATTLGLELSLGGKLNF